MQNNQQSGGQQGGNGNQGGQQRNGGQPFDQSHHEQKPQTGAWTQPPVQKPLTSSWSQPQKPAAPMASLSKPAGKETVKEAERKGTSPARMFIIGLVIGWLLTWMWFDLRGPRKANPTPTGTDSASLSTDQTASSASALTKTLANNAAAPTPLTSNDTIVIPPTQDVGTTVTVSSISTKDPVWAVVYEDAGGKAGNSLGAARFTPDRSNGTIELLRSTLPGLTYFVGLVADTADHTFDRHANAVLVDQNGDQILTQFVAQ